MLTSSYATSNPVTVNYTNPPPSAACLNLDQSTINPGDQVNLSGSFTDLQSKASHTVTINWGDGVGSPDVTTLSLHAGKTTFQANPHTYATAGNYTIHVTVSGLDGSTTATRAVAVNSTSDHGCRASWRGATYGQSVTFKSAVTSTVSGNGTPTGAVDFYDETTGIDLGTYPLDNEIATFSTSDLVAGSYAITAAYSGDNKFPSSQSTVSITVVGQTLSLEDVSVDSTVEQGRYCHDLRARSPMSMARGSPLRSIGAEPGERYDRLPGRNELVQHDASLRGRRKRDVCRR